MKPAARIAYHKNLWPPRARPRARTRRTTRSAARSSCAASISPESPHDHQRPALEGRPHTLLFTYLRHLAEPNNIELVQRWSDCKADFLAFHTSQLADWWQDHAYGQNGGRQLTRRRFQNRDRAHQHAFAPEPTLSRKEATDRLHTMRTRARRKYQLQEA